ncbi:MAG: PAS domain S-box protein, partial [Gaiellaceae bacterium]
PGKRSRAGSAHPAAPAGLLSGEEGYRLLFEHMDSMVCTLDLEGRLTSVNRAGELLTGYLTEELVGRSAVELIAPEQRDEAVRQFARRLATGSDYAPDESVLVTKDGRRVPIEVMSSLLVSNGRPAGVLGLVRDLTSQKSAESALQQSEERFRSAFAFAAIGMALVAPDGRWLQVNDALCEIVGYSSEELLGKSFQDITHSDDLDIDLEFVRQMLAGELNTYQMEKRYLHRLGHAVWILLSVSLVRETGGSPLYFISQIQDISERKSVEQEIARSEARLAEAQQIARIGSWEWDVPSNVVAWSDELYRIFGLEPDSAGLTYDTYLEKLHPQDRDLVDETVRRSFETGESFALEHRVLVAGGGIRWVQGRGEVEKRDGHTVSMRGTAQDITERREAEKKLREAEERYRTLIEQLPLTTYIRPLQMESSNTYVSPQVEELLGYSAAEWLTNTDLLARIIHPDDWDRVRATGEQVRRTGEPSHLEYRYITADGRTVWVLDETYVVRDERGEPHSVQGYLLDITERKRAEEERDRLRDELHHAHKLDALGQLAGGVAHDFNNMLTAIKGYSELLIDALEPGSSQRKEAEQIRRAAEQASTLPRQLLAFSRKQVLSPSLIDLDEVVMATNELLERSVGETIEVVTTPASRSARVVADPSQVGQALLNLTLNARDAMPHGGVITISTDRRSVPREVAVEHDAIPGDYAVIAVTDTGHGMGAQTAARVLEPFFTTKSSGQGSGLGLSTVYGMVRQSGGFMRVESEPGRGSCFELYFPTSDAVIEPVADSGDLDAAPVATATVMLVEDEVFVRELAETALDRAGYRVLSAASGAEALEHCESWGAAVDVLVTDMVMPGMGGRELAEGVLSRQPETAVIFMSGYTAEEPVLDGVRGRSPTFLQKPFSPRDLVQAVGDALGVHTSNGIDAHTHAATHHGSDLPAAITCVVADDHPAVLDSISRYLESHGIQVVGRVARGDEALRQIEALQPTIALLDVGMEPLTGIEVARRTAEASSETRAVLYTGHRDSALLQQALDAGAYGFVLKEAPLAELARALEIVAGGGTYVDPELSGALTSSRAVGSLSPLTPRERETLALLAEGMTNEKAGSALGISAETVQSHVRNAMGKLEADTRTQAVATAIRQSFIN